MQRVFGKIILIGIVITTLFFAGLDPILKITLEGIIPRIFSIETVIGQIRVFHDRVLLRNGELRLQGTSIKFRDLRIRYCWEENFRLRLKSIECDSLKVIMSDYRSLQTQFEKYKRMVPVGDSGNPRGKMRIILTNAQILGDDGKGNKFSFGFTFRGVLAGKRIDNVELLSIHEGAVESSHISMDSLVLCQRIPHHYLLVIPEIKLKASQKEGKNIRLIKIPIEYIDKGVVFTLAHTGILGTHGVIQAKANFTEKGLCGEVSVQECEMQNLIALWKSREPMQFTGRFNGSIDGCVFQGKIVNISGRIDNFKGGIINIKRQEQMRYLKNQLTPQAYSSLVENLKNYVYQKGEIVVGKEKKNFFIDFHFSSPAMGARNLKVFYHPAR